MSRLLKIVTSIICFVLNEAMALDSLTSRSGQTVSKQSAQPESLSLDLEFYKRNVKSLESIEKYSSLLETKPGEGKQLSKMQSSTSDSSAKADLSYTYPQMKKIGLEIPESTRKDMDEPSSSTNPTTQSSFKSTSLRRLLELCISGVVDSNGVKKICEITIECTDFHQACTTCTASWCTVCGGGYTISSHNCTCPSPKIVMGYMCVTCSSPCSTCSTSGTTCISCISGYSLQDSTCFVTVPGCLNYSSNGACNQCAIDNEPTGGGSACSPCGPGTASAGGLCQPCSPMCSTCSGSTANCVICAGATPLKMGDGSCIDTCGTGNYYASQACNNCPGTCTDCTGGTALDCTTCVAGYVFQIDPRTCAAGCPSGQFVSGTSCAMCTSPCSECTDGSGNSCTSCQGGYYLYVGSCVMNCPLGTYANPGDNLCEPCDSSCSTCSGTAPNQCLTCPGTFLTVAKYCKTGSCESNEYAEAGNICHSCDASCATCNAGGGSGCTSCASPNYLTYTKQCVSTCPAGTSRNDGTRTCDGCYAKCATCSVPNNASQCTSCPTGRQLNAGFCRLSCNANQYYIPGTDDCGACNPLCSSCTGPGITSGECTCSGSFVKMLNGDCVASCPSNHFKDTNSNCIECHPECLTCNGQGNDKCTSCSAGLFKTLGGHCKTSCEIGEYVVSSNICAGCDGSCLSCRGTLGNCTECYTGSYLYINPSNQGSCGGSCPSGYTPNATLKKCQACVPQCLTCTIPNDPFACITCQANRTLRADKYCARNCPSGEYFKTYDDTCYSCHSLCLTCTGNLTTDCPTCSASAYRKLDGECVTICPPGTYADTAKTCQLCHGSCLTCNGPTNANCLSCSTGLFRTVGHQCKSSCDAHNYYDSSHFCYLCHASCNTCENATSPNTCLSCYTGSWLNRASNSCGNTCPTSYMPVNSTWTCETCAPTCATCTVVASPYNCSACGTGRWLRPDKYCQKDCPISPPQYFLDLNDSCIDCNPYCASCTNGTSFCPTCTASAYRSLVGECILACPLGTYPDVNKICQLCNSTCQGCIGPLKSNCISCNSGKMLTVGKECKSTCDPHEWASTQMCYPCHSACNTCNSSSINGCLSCYNNTWLNPLTSTCGTTCPTSYGPVNATWTCVTCASTCATCTAASNPFKCSSCGTGRWLRPDNYCQKNCTISPPQYFLDLNDSCIDCNPNCASCTNGTAFCPTCKATAYRSLAGECLASCPLGTYPDSTRTCQLCNSTCRICTGPTSSNCSSCQAGYFLDGTNCIICHNSCSRCNGPLNNQCTGCTFGSPSTAGYCTTCLSNQWLSTLGCSNCHPSCLTCSGPNSTNCKSCLGGVSVNTTTNSCYSCSPLCANCSGPKITDCLNCSSGAYNDSVLGCVASCPAGSGVDKLFNQCRQCTVSNCVNCIDNYLNCTECDTANGYIINSGTCVVQPTNVKVTSRFDAIIQTWVVSFSEAIALKDPLANTTFIAVEDSTTASTLRCGEDQLSCEIINIVENGFSIKFSSRTDVTIGKATIVQTPAFIIRLNVTSRTFTDYPIIQKVSLRSAAMKSLASTTATSMEMVNSARAPLTLAMAASGPGAGIFLDIIYCNFLQLQLLQGPLMVYPDMILSFSPSFSILPVKVGNPFQSWADKAPCSQTEIMTRSKVGCNMLDNYGEDFLVLMVTLSINIVISLMGLFINSRKTRRLSNAPSSKTIQNADDSTAGINVSKDGSPIKKRGRFSKQIKSSKIVKWITGAVQVLVTSYGISFWVMKMVGIQLEVFIYSFYNVSTSNRHPASGFGLMIGIAFIGVYVYLGFQTFKLAAWLWNQTELLRAEETPKESLKPTKKKSKKITMGQLVDFSESPAPYLNFVYEPLLIPRYRYQLILPLVGYLRSITLSIILVWATEWPAGQILIGILIEVGYLIFFIKSNIRASKIEFWAETGTQVAIAMYLVFKLFTLLDISETNRQKYLGIPMLLCLAVIMLIGMAFALYSLISLMVQNIRYYIAKKKREAAKEASRNLPPVVEQDEVRSRKSRQTASSQVKVSPKNPIKNISKGPNRPVSQPNDPPSLLILPKPIKIRKVRPGLKLLKKRV